MYTNNQFGTNNGMGYTGAMANGQAIQKPRMINPINEEERKALKENPVDEFNLNVTNEEMGKAFCTHKEGNQYAVIINADHTVTCKICHETFNPDICTEEYIEETSRRMQNILQTLKFLGVDLSADVVRGYFGFIPYIKRVPQLYKLVNNSFSRYNENTMFGGVQSQNNGANVFNAFSAIMNPGMPLYQQPTYMNAPVWGAPQGAAAPTGWNPFYQQAPVVAAPAPAPQQDGQQPTTPVPPVTPVVTPQVPVTTPAPAPAPQQDDQQKTVTTNMPLSL